MVASILWILGFGGLLAWLVLLLGKSRGRPGQDEPVRRAHVIGAALFVAVLGFGSAYVWGVDVARQGMDRIADSLAKSPGSADRSAEPPRARLFLRYLQLVLDEAAQAGVSRLSSARPARSAEQPRQATIGYSPEAALQLPRSYGLKEAKQGWDLVTVSERGPQGLTVEAVANIEPTDTRVVLRAERRDVGADTSALSSGAITRAATRLIGRGSSQCEPGPEAQVSLDGPGAVYVFFCAGREPKAALVVERDLGTGNDRPVSVPVRITPLVWRGTAFRPHHIQIAAGSLIQIGAMADALPGVTLWEVPAPAGRAELFYPPENLLAACPEWLSGRRDEGFFSSPQRIEAPAPERLAQESDSICVLPFTPPFGLEVRRLLPDLPGIGARSLWAAGLMTTPALLVLLLLCGRARSELLTRRFCRLLSLGWIAVFFAALAVWRLLWAHRIDMLRDYESVGARVLQNQVLLVMVGAALAATCVLSWTPSGRLSRRLGLAALAWALWLAVSGYALVGDLAAIPLGARLFGQALLSLAVGTAAAWLAPLGDALIPPVRDRVCALVSSRGSSPIVSKLGLGDSADWILALAWILGLIVAMIAADALWPAAVLLKLSFAWLFVLATYAALRAAMVTPEPISERSVLVRLAITLGLAALGFLSLAAYDTGVSVAMAGPGLCAALLLAGHDARFADGALRNMDSYRRHHAPLVWAQAGLLFVLGVGVALWSAAGLVATSAGEPDAMLSRSVTLGAVDLLLLLALFFIPVAALSYMRRGPGAAWPWIAVAVGLFALWVGRDVLLGQVLQSSSSQAGHRIAIVLDPGYALLRSESKFLAGITAWRETIAPPSAGGYGAGDLVQGQGYFGAQLIDPGVLLSVENDYFPVLLLRETGVGGIVLTMLFLLVLTAGLWTVASSRFRYGSAAQRARSLAAVVMALVYVYQPLASLGVMPLTGISWPGLGLDSPSDLWLLVVLVLWVLVWEPRRAQEVSASQEAKLDEFDRELRNSRLFRRTRAGVGIASAVLVLGSLLLVGRGATFALRRPNPVDPQGRAVKPFDSLEHAVDYVYRLQCPWSQTSTPGSQDATAAARALIPEDLLGDTEHPGVMEFHASLRAAWQAERERGVAALARFLSGEGACGDTGPMQTGRWTLSRSPDDPSECRMRFKMGWPEIELAIERNAKAASPLPEAPEQADNDAPDGEELGEAALPGSQDSAGDEAPGEPDAVTFVHTARCRVDARADVLKSLRFPARRPYQGERIRLVSRAMGAAARDLGELVSGNLSVRLRPGAGQVDLSRARTGYFTASEIRISRELSVVIEDGAAVLRRSGGVARPGEGGESWLFLREPPPGAAGETGQVQVLEAAEEGAWKLLTQETERVELSRLALLVVGGLNARSLWLFRPRTEWPGEEAAVHPLLADDIATVRGERRRHYLFGGLLPEVGWVNPYHGRMSLGLDGWVHVAMAEYEARTPAQEERPLTWLDGGDEIAYCGTLDPAAEPAGAGKSGEPSAGAEAGEPLADPGQAVSRRSPDAAEALDPALARVCSRSAADGTLECRVSIQPELAIYLRHLTELISLQPARFAGSRTTAPVRSAFTLLRGDTGEIVAQGEFVPGRASTVYAPATPEIEQYLIRMREDREPETGRKLPLSERGEASGEKVEWAKPIAVGSTMKPILARAAELADPAFTRSLVLSGSPTAGAECAHNRKVHAIFGHCPPTESLWNHPGSVDITRFLADSVNWYQAALGILGTAAAGGSFGIGSPPKTQPGPEEALPGASGEVDLDALIRRNAGAYTKDQVVWTRYQGKRVVTDSRSIRLEALRQTAMWQRFEELLGRPLCLLGSKAQCRRQGALRDLCAVRALPITKPTSDLRHLVALGASTFDLYPQVKTQKRLRPVVSSREYLQFLRGSGLHPLGSLSQLTDAFNRLVFEHGRDPAQDGAYRLAASWFPVAPHGALPAWDCKNTLSERTVRSGICEAIRSGTARAVLGPLLDDPRFLFYGAKTGTVDSLADIAENSVGCEHYRIGHTIPGRPAGERDQPYWLPCGKRSLTEVNDSLLVVSFAVRGEGNTTVPLTLGLQFQGGGGGLATQAARYYLDAIHTYFGAPQAAEP